MSDKLDYALRRNTGRRMKLEFLSDATRALGRPVTDDDLLPLPETDALLTHFREMRQHLSQDPIRGFDFNARYHQVTDLVQEAALLRRRYADQAMYLYRSRSKWCGAIRTSSHEVLGRLPSLVVLDQEDVIASNIDASCGLFCSWSAEYVSTQAQSEFHLTAWFSK